MSPSTSAGRCPLYGAQARLGRDFGGVRFGPRPIDLDIIFYEGEVVQVSQLRSQLCPMAPPRGPALKNVRQLSGTCCGTGHSAGRLNPGVRLCLAHEQCSLRTAAPALLSSAASMRASETLRCACLPCAGAAGRPPDSAAPALAGARLCASPAGGPLAGRLGAAASNATAGRRHSSRRSGPSHRAAAPWCCPRSSWCKRDRGSRSGGPAAAGLAAVGGGRR